MTYAPPVIEIQHGPHTMVINRAKRTVRIFSDTRASAREGQRHWHDVVRKLRELGCVNLSQAGTDGDDEIFAGSFLSMGKGG